MLPKFLESTWSAENTFMYHVKTVTDQNDCGSGYTTDDQRTDVKFCDGDKGMLY
jgi:hypothetical protein